MGQEWLICCLEWQGESLALQQPELELGWPEPSPLANPPPPWDILQGMECLANVPPAHHSPGVRVMKETRKLLFCLETSLKPGMEKGVWPGFPVG